MSQDVFQKQLDTAFKGLDGVTGFADGTFVYGSSEVEHDRNLTKLIKGAQQKGVVFNKKKYSSSVRKSASSNTPGRHKESNLTTRNYQLLLDMKPPKNVKSLPEFPRLSQLSNEIFWTPSYPVSTTEGPDQERHCVLLGT